MKYLLILFPIASVSIFSYFLLFVNSSNHTGVKFLDIVWLLLACSAIAVYKYITRKDSILLISLAVNIFAIVFFFAIDKFNIMVQYDEWIRRGMPGSFEPSRPVQYYTNLKLEERLGLLLEKHLNGQITKEEFERESEYI